MKSPSVMMYALVVSRVSVRIAFLITGLIDLDLLSESVQNSYISAPPRDKSWFKAGPELGHYEGHDVVIVQALYGMTSLAAIWQKNDLR